MPTLQRSALVAHSAESMFELVADIESYPEFLPWCGGAKVLERGATHQVASVSIAKNIRGSEFTTRNRLDAPHRIDMKLIDGPFRHLEGTWRFRALDEESCRAELEVDFEFASRLLGRMISPAFSRVCDSLVYAFTARADRLYGARREAGSGRSGGRGDDRASRIGTVSRTPGGNV